ncbi:MAG: PilT/PilU family type 4a pilus ATPase [bacterium]
MEPNQVQQVKQKVQSLADRIPRTLASVERQQYIGRELLKKVSEQDRLIMRDFIDAALRQMRVKDASDIDMGGYGSGGKIWLRVQGIKKPVEAWGTFSTDETDVLIQNLIMESQQEHLYENKNLDFSYIFRENEIYVRNRADAYFDMDSLALNMRAINTKIRSYEGFGFHPNVTKSLALAHTKEGLILVTGITGSGKSSTLDAIVDMNNQTIEAHIVIIASPVEFVHSSKKCIIRHREVGRDTQSFKHGTIEALRQDPDIIIIGEMRDPQTILAGLEVADSGHKVLSTLHTSSAIESIDRIIGEIPPEEQERVRNRLADVLRCVISQKLIPSLDGKRVLAKEIMIMTPSIRAAIKNNNTSEIYQMINEGVKFGMSTMEQDLKQLIIDKNISKETAMSFANNKRMMQQLLQGL